MNQIVIFSDNKALFEIWSNALSSSYKISLIHQVNADIDADIVVIDAVKIDEDKSLFAIFNKKNTCFLIVGADWAEDNQIKALVGGAAGYCKDSDPPELLLQAINSLLKGDVWIPRHLVPKVIDKLMQMKGVNEEQVDDEKTKDALNQIQTLSNRELDVAKMIRLGENNKKIASALCISERTVKAHLTSIFRKLNVRDRLHLAIFIREHV